jgi:hypothetical protein
VAAGHRRLLSITSGAGLTFSFEISLRADFLIPAANDAYYAAVIGKLQYPCYDNA